MKLNKSLLLLVLGLSFLAASCVSKKSFNALQAEKDDLAMKLDKLQKDFDETKTAQESEIASLKDANSQLTSQKDALGADLTKAKADFDTQLSTVKASVADKQAQLDDLKSNVNSAFADVEKAVASSNAKITEVANFLYLDFEDDVNFRSGSARVDASDDAALEELANMLKSNPNVALMIEGHTDDKKILAGKKYADNWDLSVARATQVVRKLVKMGVNPSQLIASGRADQMPIGDNATKDGRAMNRRTEAIVVPNLGKLYKISKG